MELSTHGMNPQENMNSQDKPKFDPNKPFTAEDKPKFDPNKPFVAEDAQSDTLKVDIGAKGSIADKMNNPGNLTFAGQPGATQDGQWAKFESAYEGFNALKRDINAKKKRGYTLGEALTLYSKPAGGEVDSNYLNNIAKHLNVSLDAPFKDMDTHDVAEAVAKFESGTKIEKINPTPDFSGKYLGNILTPQ